MPNRIPLDPTLPKNFDITPNEKRSKSQLDAWWDHPYCVTHNGAFLVYCLNGGAWDRPTMLGKAETYDEACELAERRQAEWVKRREEPIFYHSFEPPFQMIRQPQRPDHDDMVVASFDTMEELNAWSKANFKGAAS
ncbi:DNA-binding protein [Salmonella enterica subsp. enterica]|nr:DNA-binding protein [Salmonella enterica subsp. enterica]EEJ7209127.1 DNA-binding protein [Salmonella enterica subsp. enterica]